MVAKKKRTGTAASKGRVKVGNLKLNRETVKNLSGNERKQIKGGGLTLDTKTFTNTCAKL